MPDFLLLGAPKCGTSALHTASATHPERYLSEPEEPKRLLADGPHRLLGRPSAPPGRHLVAQSRYSDGVPETIGQRQLRNDNAEIMRRVEAGETFVVTRNGKPVAELRPLAGEPARRRITVREAKALLADLPPIDVDQWYRDRAADDEIFGSDDIER